MDQLEKYIKELEGDVQLDELNLKEAALMLPAKKAKWVSRLMIEKSTLNELYFKREKLLKIITDKIKEEAPVKLAGPTLERAAQGHEEIKLLDIEINTKKNIVEFLEKIEKTMQSIGFDIKNLIDLIKMETT